MCGAYLQGHGCINTHLSRTTHYSELAWYLPPPDHAYIVTKSHPNRLLIKTSPSPNYFVFF